VHSSQLSEPVAAPMREVHKALASKPHPNDESPLPSPADELSPLLAAVLAYRPQP